MLGINDSTPPTIRAGYMGIYQFVTETDQQPFGMPPHIHLAKRAPDPRLAVTAIRSVAVERAHAPSKPGQRHDAEAAAASHSSPTEAT